MSARYSSSPALQLKVARSRLRSLLLVALSIVTACSLWAIHVRGYPLPALLLAPLATVLLWRLRKDAMVGAELCFAQDGWMLQQDARQRRIALSRRSTATRWVIYLVYNDLSSGSPGQIWLYADSASAEQLRRLRVRVALLS